MSDCTILSYGYNAQIIPSPQEEGSSLPRLASDMLAQLQQYLGTQAKRQSIIFLAHNLGGILVKQLLVQSALSVSPRVHKHTAAILFFGTPHSGTNIGTLLLKITSSVLGGKPNNSLLDVLVKDSTALQYTNESWIHLHQAYEIFSFYETRPLPVGNSVTMIVNKHEATLNVPHERTIALDASHAEIVKFPNANSASYVTVLHCLQGVLGRLPRTTTVANVPPPPSAPTAETPHANAKRINITGYVHVFERNLLNQTEEVSISDMIAKSPTVLLNRLNARNQDDVEPLLWFHIPLNNTSWINPCLQNIVNGQGTDLVSSITEHKFWLSHERKRQDLPHSRHFEPSCFLSSQDKVTQFVIYLPYLHWDSVGCFTQRAKYFSSTRSGIVGNVPDNLSEEAKATYEIMRKDMQTASIHPRRSLDQFYYSSLPETSSRDQDQILSKYSPRGGRGGKKMIMVDQLWLWFMEAHDSTSEVPGEIKTSILTSFPRKEREAGKDENDLEDIADLRQAIVDEANTRDDTWAENRANYIGLIIEQAVNVMLGVRTEESLDIFSVFRAAIGEATEAQTGFFRKFQEKMKSNSDDISDSQTKRDEVNLALEISDIIDELNSIDRVFQMQKDTLETATKRFEGVGIQPGKGRYLQLAQKLSVINTQYIEAYMKQIKHMTADAHRTKDSLMDLLDLQQKEETLKEAHYSNYQADAAREQANATEAQSQILLLFTIVTIVFAPLSFFTSYFGMNVREFTGDVGNTNQQRVWTVMGPISVAIIVGLLGGAYVMYKQTRNEQDKRKAKRRARDAGSTGGPDLKGTETA
ncbi:hypothetical protein BKA63DRAFT_155094 [Paraphoma chrysanthemicola]|nr:hypothetical protein BKA63DRAFT_155094 [Paraphoma chrysanthemicola]